MPTYDWNLTRNEIIQRSHRIIGAYNSGVTADQLSFADTALNSMVKAWQSDHIFLWTLAESTVSLTATNASYSLSSANIIGIDKAWLRINSTEYPLRQVSYREYEEIPQKTDAGQPLAYCVNNAISQTLYVYPTPEASYTFYYLGVKKLADFDAAGDNADFPQRWIDAISYGLAAQLADEYGLPISERQWITAKANEIKEAARRGERENKEEEFVEGAY